MSTTDVKAAERDASAAAETARFAVRLEGQALKQAGFSALGMCLGGLLVLVGLAWSPLIYLGVGISVLSVGVFAWAIGLGVIAGVGFERAHKRLVEANRRRGLTWDDRPLRTDDGSA